MKTIDDLPVEVLANILSFTTPYIETLVKLRLINSKWNEAVEHRLSMVKHLIQTDDVNDSCISSISAETMFSIDPGCSWDDKYTRYIISLMEMLPGLQAVQMQNFYKLRKKENRQNSKYPYVHLYVHLYVRPYVHPYVHPYVLEILSIQNKIFSYLNSRPTIKALGIDIEELWDHDLIEPKPERAVKLKNITMLSVKCNGYLHDENCKKFIEYFFPTDHEFEQLWINDFAYPNSIFQKKTKIRKLSLTIEKDWSTGNKLPLVMPNHTSDLEILGVKGHTRDTLEYLSRVTSLSPKLTSIHVFLYYGQPIEPMKNFKQFNQVENLVIEYNCLESFADAEKIIRMYPMVKNLSIKSLVVLSEVKILRLFHFMPNLSILHLVYYRNSKKNPWTVNVDNMVSAYNLFHGRLIKICAVEKGRYYISDSDEIIFESELNFMTHIPDSDDPYQTHKPVIFKRGFDFMKHIFYSHDCNQPHILIE